MKKLGPLAKPYRVEDGKKFRLKDFDPGDTGKMRSPLAPIEAGSAEQTTRPFGSTCEHRFDVDAESAQKPHAGLRQHPRIACQFDRHPYACPYK